VIFGNLCQFEVRGGWVVEKLCVSRKLLGCMCGGMLLR
jgi:hypothetical protein